MSKSKHLICILGPTASGKTSLAVEVAQHFNCEVISCDSRQFYREMRIGTARPSSDELKGITHHFLGHLSVEQEYTVSDFEQDALQQLDLLFENTDVVVMVGGSGLFADAVCYGMDELPASDPAIREELQNIFEREGVEALQSKLLELDPEFYEEIDLNNHVRLMRAIEVCMLSGKKFSELRTGQKADRPFNIHRLGLMWDRDVLNKRINQRVDLMMEEGLLEEVTSLLPHRNTNAMQSVGYRELMAHLDGETTLQEAVEKIKVNTRRFAKRQMTWFQKDEKTQWISHDDIASVVNSVPA